MREQEFSGTTSDGIHWNTNDPETCRFLAETSEVINGMKYVTLRYELNHVYNKMRRSLPYQAKEHFYIEFAARP